MKFSEKAVVRELLIGELLGLRRRDQGSR